MFSASTSMSLWPAYLLVALCLYYNYAQLGNALDYARC